MTIVQILIVDIEELAIVDLKNIESSGVGLLVGIQDLSWLWLQWHTVIGQILTTVFSILAHFHIALTCRQNYSEVNYSLNFEEKNQIPVWMIYKY